MNKIHLQIHKSSELRDNLAFLFEHSIITGFMFGIIVGIGILFTIEHLPSLPSGISSKNQLGAIIEAIPLQTKTVSNSNEFSTLHDTPTVQADAVQHTQIATVSSDNIQNDLHKKSLELDLLIKDREIAMSRLSDEIELIKNKSIALIAAFNQNCGNWKDDCAKPYTTELEASNSTYNDLANKREALSAELTELKKAGDTTHQ